MSLDGFITTLTEMPDKFLRDYLMGVESEMPYLKMKRDRGYEYDSSRLVLLTMMKVLLERELKWREDTGRQIESTSYYLADFLFNIDRLDKSLKGRSE